MTVGLWTAIDIDCVVHWTWAVGPENLQFMRAHRSYVTPLCLNNRAAATVDFALVTCLRCSIIDTGVSPWPP